MKKIILLTIIVILASCLWMGYEQNKDKSNDQNQSKTVFTPAQTISPFSLIDTTGKPFNNQRFNQQWTLLFFGSSQCSQTCAETLENLKLINQILYSENNKIKLATVMISVDPEHDTLKKLSDLMQHYNPNFIAVSGDTGEIMQFAGNLNSLSKTSSFKKSHKPSINQNGDIFLVTPQGALTLVFSAPLEPKIITRMINNLITKTTS